MTSSSAVRYLRLTLWRNHGDSELFQMPRIGLARRSRHRVDTRLVLRERDRVAEVLLAGEDHKHPVDAESDAAVRRRSHAERVQQEAELRLLILAADAEEVEDTGLDVRLVNPKGTTAELVAVPDQVVGECERVRGILVEAVLPLRRRTREGMVDSAPPLLFLVPLEHRKVRDPEPRPGALVDQIQALRKMDAQCSEHTRGHRPPVGREEERLAGPAGEGFELLRGQELRDRRADLARLVVHQVRETLGAPLL